MAKTALEDGNSEGDFCYLENICGAGQTKKLNIDAGKHVLATFLN